MCHFFLLLPLIALPVFWIMPTAMALLVYGAVLTFSGAIYWHAVQVTRRPVLTGAEGLIGETAEIVEARGRQVLARVRNELWRVASGNVLRAGDKVTIVAVERLTLRVEALDARGGTAGGLAQKATADSRESGL